MSIQPDVSVVIATRDRASCLARLLRCIKQQDQQNFECIVVDDSSMTETLNAYEGLWRDLDERFRLETNNEHTASGPSATRNRGIKAARGEFIAFCDDDDLWTRTDHLRFAVDAMRRHRADMFFGNMQTSRGGSILGADFYGTVRHFFARNPLPDNADLYEVSRKDRAAGMKHMFLHCDSLVVSRALLHRTGLFWEKLSMAEDRDIGLRLLDRAEKVLYRDVVVANYDRTAQAGICKTYTEDEIRQFVVLAMLHAETTIQDAALRRVARGYRAWMLLELAQSAREAGRADQARELARQSILLRPTVAAFSLLLRGGASPRKMALQRSEAG